MTVLPDTDPARLIPKWASEWMPEPVRESRAKAAELRETMHQARVRRAEARQAARDALQIDAAAEAESIRKGTKRPKPTAPARAEETLMAEDACTRLAAQYDQAALAHQRTVLEHQAAVLEALAKAKAVAAEEADPAAYLAKFDHLSDIAGLEVAVAGIDAHRDHHRRGRVYDRLGKTRFDGRRRLPAGLDPDQATGDLVFAVGAMAKPISETVGQRQDREAKEAERAAARNRGWKQMAKGDAVHVPAA